MLSSPSSNKHSLVDLTNDEKNEGVEQEGINPLLQDYSEQRAAKTEGLDLLWALRHFYGSSNIEFAHRILGPIYPADCSGESWLNDSNIQDYLSILEAQGFNGTKVVVIDSGHAASNVSSVCFVQSLMNDVQSRRKIKAKLEGANLIFCPVNLGGNHWGLWVLDRRDAENHKVYCLDGFNSNPFVREPEGYSKDQRTHFDRYIKPLAEFLNFDASQAFSQEIPRQQNSFDCGSAVCYWAKIIIRGTHLNEISSQKFDAEQYTQFRLEIAKAIVTQHKLSKLKKLEKRSGIGASIGKFFSVLRKDKKFMVAAPIIATVMTSALVWELSMLSALLVSAVSIAGLVGREKYQSYALKMAQADSQQYFSLQSEENKTYSQDLVHAFEVGQNAGTSWSGYAKSLFDTNATRHYGAFSAGMQAGMSNDKVISDGIKAAYPK